MYYSMQTILKYLVPRFIMKSPNTTTMLGRWTLKHNCKSENIVVLNANRDHCGDLICGDPKKYKELTENIKE